MLMQRSGIRISDIHVLRDVLDGQGYYHQTTPPLDVVARPLDITPGAISLGGSPRYSCHTGNNNNTVPYQRRVRYPNGGVRQ